MYLIGVVQVYISCVAYTTVGDPFFEAKGAEACPPRLTADSSTVCAACEMSRVRGDGAWHPGKPGQTPYSMKPVPY